MGRASNNSKSVCLGKEFNSAGRAFSMQELIVDYYSLAVVTRKRKRNSSKSCCSCLVGATFMKMKSRSGKLIFYRCLLIVVAALVLLMSSKPAVASGLGTSKIKEKSKTKTQAAQVQAPKVAHQRRSGDATINEVVALAGQRVELKCPTTAIDQSGRSEDIKSVVGGEHVQWRKNNQPLEFPGPRWRLDPVNGSLSIASAQPILDEGSYECLRISADEHSELPSSGNRNRWASLSPSRRHLFQLNLLVPPRVAPFEFPREAQVGMRLVLTCSALEGQQPLSFVWLKDNQLISTTAESSASHGSSLSSADAQTSGGHRISLAQIHRRQLADRGASSSSSLSGASNSQQERDELERDEDEEGEELEGGVVADELGLRVRHADDYSLLSIERLELRHSGRYTCSVENEAARSSYSAQLTINAPPVLVVEPKDQDLIAGQTGQLDCTASGQPKPSISWLRARETSAKQWDYLPVYENLRFTQLANGSLSIANISLREQGFYLCSAKNGFGPEVSKLIKISVHEPARFPSKYRSLEVRVDERAELECSAHGDQPITIEWFDKEMKSIGRDDKRFIIDDISTDLGAHSKLPFGSQSSSSNSSSTPILSTALQASQIALTSSASSRLILTRSGRSHSGHYTCQATNKFGTDKMLTNLLILDVPDKVNELKVTNVTSTTISLRWQLSFTGNSPVTSYLVQYQSDDPLDELLTQQQQLLTGKEPSNLASNSPLSAQFSTKVESGGAASSLRATLDALSGAVQAASPDEAFDRTLVELTLEQSATNLVVRDLSPFCLYRLRLAAINKIGLGEFSDWIRAKTEEAPPNGSALKLQAAATGPNSVKLTWSPPDRRSWNGQLTGFSLGYRPLDSNYELNKTLEWSPPTIKSLFLTRQMATEGTASSLNQPTIEKDESQRKQLPKGNLTASDQILELKAQLKQLLALQQQELVAHLTNLQRSTTYLVWVQAINARGLGPQSHSISVRTLDDVPPSAPQLRVQASSSSSLTLTWSLLSNFVSPANQYSLFYRKLPTTPLSLPARWSASSGSTLSNNNSSVLLLLDQTTNQQQPEPGPFIERTLSSQQLLVPSDPQAALKLQQVVFTPQQQQQYMGQQVQQFVYTLDQLECGALYEMYMTTRNSVGKSEPSALVSARTLGEPPQAPPNRNSIFAKIGSNEVALNLAGWLLSGSCPLTHMHLRYKISPQHNNSNSTTITSNIPISLITALNSQQSEQQQQQQSVPLYLLKNLIPGTCYELEIIAQNAAGHSSAQYEFVTAYANGTRASFGSRRLTMDETYTAYRAHHQLDDRGQPYERSLEQQSFTSQSTTTASQLLPLLLMLLCFVCLIISSTFCYYRLADSWKRQRRSSAGSGDLSASTRTSNHHSANTCLRQPNNSSSSLLGEKGSLPNWRIGNDSEQRHHHHHHSTLKHRRGDNSLENTHDATLHYCVRDTIENQQQLLNQKIPSTSSFCQSVSMKDFNLLSHPGNSSTLNLKSCRNRATLTDNNKAGTLRARLIPEMPAVTTFESSPATQQSINCTSSTGASTGGQVCSIYATSINKQKPNLNEHQGLVNGSYPVGNQSYQETNDYDSHHLFASSQYPNTQNAQLQETSWTNYGVSSAKVAGQPATYAIPIGNYANNEQAVYDVNNSNQVNFTPAYGQQNSIDACIQQLLEQQYQQQPLEQQQQQQYAMIVNQKMISNNNRCMYSNNASNFSTSNTIDETNQQATNLQTNGAQSIIDSSSSSSGIDMTPHMDCSSVATGTTSSNTNYQLARPPDSESELHTNNSLLPPSMVQQTDKVPLK